MRNHLGHLIRWSVNILLLPHCSIHCNEWRKMRQILDNLCPITHYGMVVKSWNIVGNNRRVTVQKYHQATDTLSGLFFKVYAKNRFSFVKMQEEPWGIEQISILSQIDLKIALIAIAGFKYTTYEATCALTGLLYEILAKNWFLDYFKVLTF